MPVKGVSTRERASSSSSSNNNNREHGRGGGGKLPSSDHGRGGAGQMGNASNHHHHGHCFRHHHRRHEAKGGEEEAEEDAVAGGGGKWGALPLELLVEVIRRVEARERSWPGRRQVMICAAVCRSWRLATLEVVRNVEQSGLITFPISLKQPGPRESPIQCFIRRERATSTYYLYLGLSPALVAGNGKLLFAARKIRRATTTDFVISLASKDFSRASSMYVGKLRSNFLGTKFTIYDSQPPYDIAIPLNSRLSRRIHFKQVSPRVPAGNYSVATISYELNVLQSRGPRKMQCTMHSIPFAAIQDRGTVPSPHNIPQYCEELSSPLSTPRTKDAVSASCSRSASEAPGPSHTLSEPLILKNKAPRWHAQLQCWCLNFRGRVTVASVKNFQLAAAVEPSHQIATMEQDKVILQFGKIGKDIFTMDYMYPLSAFQAFAICLSSFDTKPVCE